jgi:SAM-dependent methyltransferase
MKKKYDYTNYGANKNIRLPSIMQEKIANIFKLKNRYLKFCTLANKKSPVIELGCGNGSFIRELLKEGFEKVIGIEPSSTYNPVIVKDLIIQEYATQYLKKIEQKSLGLVVALDVFEHIEYDEIKIILNLVDDKLQDGGILVFRVPNMGSPLGFFNYFGDISHVTPMNEVSIKQIALETKMELIGLYSEPFAYPKSLRTILGIAIWPLWENLYKIIASGYGINIKILTPNIMCVMQKRKVNLV